MSKVEALLARGGGGHGGDDLEQTILCYVHLCNSQFPQSVLKAQTPIDVLKDWQRQRPEPFRNRPYNHTGCDKSVKASVFGDLRRNWQPVGESNPSFQVENL